MKNLRLKSFVITVLILTVSQLSAQYQISGRVMQKSEKETPLELASVELTTQDSVFVNRATGDMNGYFQIRNVASGNYLLKVSYLGFIPKTIILSGLSKSIDLENILMEETVSQLEGVTIVASNTINKTDRQIVFINDLQKANASNGINLLATMQLPRLTVNPLTNEVTLPGDESLLFCINGVKVAANDIRALQPKDIIRIEYLDNPGVRYGDASVVINYILKREVTGGSVSMDLGNAITTWFADDQIALKINHKKSEFGFTYALRYRKPDGIYADEERMFNFTDGSKYTRFSKGSDADFREEYHYFTLNYNLLDAKYYFNATARFSGLYDDKIRYSKQYLAHVPNDITHVQQGTKASQHLPSIDLYYFRTLKNKQNLILSVVGTNINSKINQKYEETKAEELISDIWSNIAGKKYSIIGEGIYEKTFENSNRLTAGLKHTQAFADNDYTGTENALTKLDQSETYVYTEYAGKKDKFSYNGGIGLSRSWLQQTGESDYTTYTFRPKFTLQYDFSRSMFLRLRGEVYNSVPSLSSLSAVDQYIDTLQMMRGNPLLKPNLNYSTNLLFNWRKGIYGVNINSGYVFSPDAVMQEIIRENGLFIRTNENQKNWQKLNNELTFSAGPIKKHVMLSLTGGMNYYVSNGNTYHHTCTNFYMRGQLMLMYKKMSAIFQMNTANDRFYGETMDGGENSHLIMLSYNGGKYTIAAGMMLPFSDQYKRYSENRNIYMPYEMNTYANDFSRMILIKFGWNFDFGRKVKGGTKRINNSDTDSGVVRTD